VCIVMDGAGAVIVFMQEFVGAQKWAQSRVPTANLLSDRARFLDQFTTLISRPGSVQATRGNDRQLEKLVRGMLGVGYDLAEWMLPVELKTIGHAKPPPPAPKAPTSETEEPGNSPDSSNDEPVPPEG
ncbi:MAG: hypothetical protein ACREUE_15970, partial [Panacagrimonas sp.]